VFTNVQYSVVNEREDIHVSNVTVFYVHVVKLYLQTKILAISRHAGIETIEFVRIASRRRVSKLGSGKREDVRVEKSYLDDITKMKKFSSHVMSMICRLPDAQFVEAIQRHHIIIFLVTMKSPFGVFMVETYQNYLHGGENKAKDNQCVSVLVG